MTPAARPHAGISAAGSKRSRPDTAPARLLRTAAMGAALLLTLALAACGGGGDSSGESGDGVTTITFWQFWPAETVQPLLDRFEAENPRYKVDMQQLTWASGLEKITAAVAAGNPPDLCELGSTWFAKFAANGALVDVTDDVADLRDDYLMWDAVTYRTGVYGYPWLTGTRAVFYNRKEFARAGLDPNRAPETWAELLAAAAALHEPDQQLYGYGMNSGERYVQFKKFMPFVWGNGGSVLDETGRECTFDDRAVRDALDFYLTLKNVSLMESQDVLDQAFLDGHLGIHLSGAWLLKKIPEEAPGLDFATGLVPRPSRSTGTHASFGGGEILASFARSDHPEAAQVLARWLIRAENAMEIVRVQKSVLPAAKGAASDPFFRDPDQAVFLKQLETAVFPPSVEAWVEIEDILDKWVEMALYGKTTPAAAIHDACFEIDALLAKRAR